jgi:hypothetical protein
VVFDACTLYPAPLRDILMEMAALELFRAKWTDRIHEEWISFWKIAPTSRATSLREPGL